MARQHKLFGEGLLTGLVGAIVAAVWFLLLDVSRGTPLATPNTLGQVFVARDTMPTPQIMSQAVVEYSILHVVGFAVLGIALVGLTHLAARSPSLRMGVWLGLVIGFLYFMGLLVMLGHITNHPLPWTTTIGASFVSMAAMAWVLWARHPRLRGTFDEAPLGAEVKPPPHPPGSPGR